VEKRVVDYVFLRQLVITSGRNALIMLNAAEGHGTGGAQSEATSQHPPPVAGTPDEWP
jgi:hypothetical protein